MTHQPTPDEVLRRLAGDVCSYGENPLGALARELLAARWVLRYALGAFQDISYGREGPGEKWSTECAEMIQSLLPEHPEAR